MRKVALVSSTPPHATTAELLETRFISLAHQRTSNLPEAERAKLSLWLEMRREYLALLGNSTVRPAQGYRRRDSACGRSVNPLQD
jgi:hypothetical protein